MLSEFTKPPLPTGKLLDLIRSRGMQIEDDVNAAIFLNTVGYYRFSGYALHYEIFNDRKRTHSFIKGSDFKDVVELYEFDDDLRILIFDFIAHIEIAFRTSLGDVIALELNDSHWYTRPELFTNIDTCRRFLEDCRTEIARSKEIFIENYRQNYKSPELPPIWMMVEILSMGKWSKLYADLKSHEMKKKVASLFDISPYHLQSWMHGISVLRNLCAHHCRIWNRNFTIGISLTSRQKKLIPNTRRIAAFCFVLDDMLAAIGREQQFKSKMTQLLRAHPKVPRDKMGFNPEIIRELGYE